jgi:hypothetical protein
MVRLWVRIGRFDAKSILSDFCQALNLLNLSQPTVYKELPHLKVAVLGSDPIDRRGNGVEIGVSGQIVISTPQLLSSARHPTNLTGRNADSVVNKTV